MSDDHPDGRPAAPAAAGSDLPSEADIASRLATARERMAKRTGIPLLPEDRPPQSVAGLAYRIGVEIVVAVGFGLGSGLLIDHWLGTRPWGLVIMFFLGAGAGVLNVYRAIGDAHAVFGTTPPPPRRRPGRPTPNAAPDTPSDGGD